MIISMTTNAKLEVACLTLTKIYIRSKKSDFRALSDWAKV